MTSDKKTKRQMIDGKLVLTRTFNAPRDLVFAAWTDPEKMQTWWGCAQTTAVETSLDLRLGGEMRNVMHIKDCGSVEQVAKIIALDPPAKFAYRAEGGPGPEGMTIPTITTTAEFFERGDQTELRLTVDGLAGTPLEEIVAGGSMASIARLDDYLSGREVVRVEA